MSTEIVKNVVEEGDLPRCLDDSHLDCRHDLPAVDAYTTLRRVADTDAVFCMNCMCVFPMSEIVRRNIPINTIEGLPF